MATISEQVADVLLAMPFERIPSSAISSARKLLLDHFCVAAAGSLTPWGQAGSSVHRQLGGTPESSIYFAREKLPAPNAAFVNGTYAHGFELDDHGGIGAHAGAVVIPAAVATGEKMGVDGRTLLAAIVSGYEVMSRLSMAMGSISSLGHHPTGTIGAFGSAAAAGKVLHLDRKQLVSAMGLAGNFPTGVTEFYRGTMEKRIFAGRASQSGVMACLLAAAGITATATIFEGEFGFCHSFSRDPDPGKILDGLGKDFHIDQFHIKRYPCAGSMDPYIEAALSLRENNPGMFQKCDNLTSIVIEGEKLTKARTGISIQDVMAAQYSIPYAVAVTLKYGRPGMQSFSEAAIEDPEVQALLTLCETTRQEDRRGPEQITIRLNNGTVIRQEVCDKRKVVSEIDKSEILSKGVAVLAPYRGEKAAREIVQALDDMVQGIEHATDVRDTIGLMPVIPAGSRNKTRAIRD